MAIDSGYWEGANSDMSSDDVAALLVELYGKYVNYCDKLGYSKDADYSKAVGIAIRMLTD